VEGFRGGARRRAGAAAELQIEERKREAGGLNEPLAALVKVSLAPERGLLVAGSRDGLELNASRAAQSAEKARSRDMHCPVWGIPCQ
jgi:hypothetical protein